jgi:thiol-disulfide isomerase/thioredoxin
MRRSLLLALVLACACTHANGPRAVGNMTLQGFDDGAAPVSLASFHGRPLVVNYFASWCDDCVAEMPRFEQVHTELGNKIAFVGVAVQDRPAEAHALVAKTGVTYTLARDWTAGNFNELHSPGLPTTLFVDAHGRILQRYTGPLSQTALRQRIRALYSV